MTLKTILKSNWYKKCMKIEKKCDSMCQYSDKRNAFASIRLIPKLVYGILVFSSDRASHSE